MHMILAYNEYTQCVCVYILTICTIYYVYTPYKYTHHIYICIFIWCGYSIYIVYYST